MLLNLTIDEASDVIESKGIIRQDRVIPGHFRPCVESPYPAGYDWLYRYEQTLAEFLLPRMKSPVPDLVGENSLLHEALVNAYCHAHHRDRLTPILVTVLSGENGFVIQVSDRGRGFNPQKVYKHYRKKRRYLTAVGNGIRKMAETDRYGVFYNPNGTEFHLLYLFDESLNDRLTDHLVVAPESRTEMAEAH